MSYLPLVQLQTLEAIAESVEDSPEISLRNWFDALKLENPVIGAYLEKHLQSLGYENMAREEKLNYLLPALMVYQLLSAQAAADTGFK